MSITKQQIKTYFADANGKHGAVNAANKLDYSDRNSINCLPDVLSQSQARNIIRRMKAARLPIPKEWL